jgi:hypothetical protein
MSDLFDIQLSFGGGHDQLEGGGVVQVHGVAVEVEEDDGREPGESLVAVHRGMVRTRGCSSAAALSSSSDTGAREP